MRVTQLAKILGMADQTGRPEIRDAHEGDQLRVLLGEWPHCEMSNALQHVGTVANECAAQVVQHTNFLVRTFAAELAQTVWLVQHDFTDDSRVRRITIAKPTGVPTKSLRQPRGDFEHSGAPPNQILRE